MLTYEEVPTAAEDRWEFQSECESSCVRILAADLLSLEMFAIQPHLSPLEATTTPADGQLLAYHLLLDIRGKQHLPGGHGTPATVVAQFLRVIVKAH
jgi:hypothetical protein